MSDPAAVTAYADLVPEWIAPSRTALVIVDMQVDFAAADGAIGLAGADLSAVPAALAAAEKLAGEARAVGARVIFVGLQTGPECDEAAWRERMLRRGAPPDALTPLCRAGEPGSAFLGPRPAPGEPVIAKTRYSGFFATDLDARLRGAALDTVVLCGLTTECCVAATAFDAFQLGYHVFVAADACAAYGSGLHVAALESLSLNCGILASAAQVAAAWRSAGAQPP